MYDTFFKRENQYWKRKPNGEVLLINTQTENRHYDGDAHIFLNERNFNQDHATQIDQAEFEAVREAHIKRLTEF